MVNYIRMQKVNPIWPRWHRCNLRTPEPILNEHSINSLCKTCHLMITEWEEWCEASKLSNFSDSFTFCQSASLHGTVDPNISEHGNPLRITEQCPIFPPFLLLICYLVRSSRWMAIDLQYGETNCGHRNSRISFPGPFVPRTKEFWNQRAKSIQKGSSNGASPLRNWFISRAIHRRRFYRIYCRQ